MNLIGILQTIVGVLLCLLTLVCYNQSEAYPNNDYRSILKANRPNTFVDEILRDTSPECFEREHVNYHTRKLDLDKEVRMHQHQLTKNITPFERREWDRRIHTNKQVVQEYKTRLESQRLIHHQEIANIAQRFNVIAPFTLNSSAIFRMFQPCWHPIPHDDLLCQSDYHHQGIIQKLLDVQATHQYHQQILATAIDQVSVLQSQTNQTLPAAKQAIDAYIQTLSQITQYRIQQLQGIIRQTNEYGLVTMPLYSIGIHFSKNPPNPSVFSTRSFSHEHALQFYYILYTISAHQHNAQQIEAFLQSDLLPFYYAVQQRAKLELIIPSIYTHINAVLAIDIVADLTSHQHSKLPNLLYQDTIENMYDLFATLLSIHQAMLRDRRISLIATATTMLKHPRHYQQRRSSKPILLPIMTPMLIHLQAELKYLQLTTLGVNNTLTDLQQTQSPLNIDTTTERTIKCIEFHQNHPLPKTNPAPPPSANIIHPNPNPVNTNTNRTLTNASYTITATTSQNKSNPPQPNTNSTQTNTNLTQTNTNTTQPNPMPPLKDGFMLYYSRSGASSTRLVRSSQFLFNIAIPTAYLFLGATILALAWL
ncbi:hypothetical protein NEHOM01_0774 [Nematocida homosporus]|uniref:uncharacterized protein n=1 Tax=Nematocida homosporus TaxID=1912981 RepID=UPI002220D5AB|nr:uncharacterized protein NEHOM01_0774 [Nematocida homosporus]KAI5185359.1 hypothetical protein NEHOM01_0774 [Nematocida homosporus]